jgi:hypothetical protein
LHVMARIMFVTYRYWHLTKPMDWSNHQHQRRGP